MRALLWLSTISWIPRAGRPAMRRARSMSRPNRPSTGSRNRRVPRFRHRGHCLDLRPRLDAGQVPDPGREPWADRGDVDAEVARPGFGAQPVEGTPSAPRPGERGEHHATREPDDQAHHEDAAPPMTGIRACGEPDPSHHSLLSADGGASPARPPRGERRQWRDAATSASGHDERECERGDRPHRSRRRRSWRSTPRRGGRRRRRAGARSTSPAITSVNAWDAMVAAT